MRVDELMCREVRACDAQDSLEAAARILWDNDVGVAPVLRDGRVVGALTDRDICMAAYTQGRPLREIPVTTAMSKELYVLHPEDQLVDALRSMRERKVRRLPVVDDEGRLLGMLSMNDLVLEAAAGGLSAHEVVAALAAIGEPRPGAGAHRPSVVRSHFSFA